MNVLVTGGAGFIGSHLTDALIRQGNQVTVIDDLSTGNWDNLRHSKNDPHLKCVAGSVGDKRLLRELLADVDEVYHLAAAVGVALIAHQPIQTIETNIYTTQLLFDELIRQHEIDGHTRCIFIASSSEVYGKNPKEKWDENDDLVFGSTSRPRWSYGASKAIDEFLALACWNEHHLPVVVGRFFNVVGPRQTGKYGMVLPRFVEAALAGDPLVVHDDGHQQRCFAHVSDVISAVMSLLRTPAAHGYVFNIGSDVPVSILELAEKVVAAAGTDATIQFQSYADAYNTDFEDIRRRVPDLTRIQSTIDYAPQYDLDRIIMTLIDEHRAPQS